MSFELCHPASPRRAVDWRWRAARSIRDAQLPADVGWADRRVVLAVAYLAALDECGGDPSEPRSSAADPDLAAAYRLLTDGARVTRWQVEARLLAGEDDEAIAGRCGIPPGIVAAYASTFFDVRPRLDRPSYILHHAINVYQDRPDDEAGAAWRWLGYGGGPRVVDYLAGGGEGQADALGLVGPRAPAGQPARLVRLVAAALTLDLNAGDARRLLALLDAIGVEDGPPSAAIGPIAASFSAMAEGLILAADARGIGDEAMAGGVGSGPDLVGRGTIWRVEALADASEVGRPRRVGS